jgi:hypothetical protein
MDLSIFKLKNRRIYQSVIFGLMAIGAVLAFYNLIRMPSIHIDEAMLIKNFINKNYFELVFALDNLQVAPIIFLWIEKLAFEISSGTDVAMRIFPFVLYFFSLILFFLLLELKFEDSWLKILGMGMFVFNIYMIDYAIIIKQYMGDVFFTLLVLWTLFKPFSSEKLKIKVLILVGSFGFFFSHITPIILLAAAIYLVFFGDLTKVSLLKLFGFWAISFLVYYFAFVYHHPLRAGMHEFWTKAMGFLPELSDTKGLYIFFKWKFAQIFRDMLSMWTYSKFIAFILACLGILWLFRNRRIHILTLLLLPMLIHFLLAAFQVYPFEPRLILYFIPLLILLILFGVQSALSFLSKKRRWLALLFFYGVFIFSFWKTFEWKYPGMEPGVKMAMYALMDKMEEDKNKVYVSSIFEHSFDYYDAQLFKQHYRDYHIIQDSKNNFIRNLEQIKTDKGIIYLLSSQLITSQEKLIEAVNNLGGVILDNQCYEESCLITMYWNL